MATIQPMMENNSFINPLKSENKPKQKIIIRITKSVGSIVRISINLGAVVVSWIFFRLGLQRSCLHF